MNALSVSVIIPVFNGERYLRSTLQSVFAQTTPPLEIIVVDDGSADGSSALVRGLDAGGITMTLLQVDNGGQSAARNAGAAVATGDLLAFLDQDDLWRPRHLEVLCAPFVDDPDIGWVYGDYDEIDGDGDVVTRRFMHAVGVTGEHLSVASIIHRDAMVLPSASVLRSTAYHAVGGFDPLLQGYEDDDLFLRIFRNGWAARFVDATLTAFRVHPGSSSTRSSFRRSRLHFFAKTAAAFPDDPRLNRYYVTDALRPRLLASTYFEYALALHSGNDAEVAEIADAIRVLSGQRLSSRRRFLLGIMRRPHLARVALRFAASLPRGARGRVPSVLLRRG